MASESSLREKVQLPMLSPTEGLRRWFPKRSRFDFGTCRRWWVCASDRMQPRLGGTRLCVAVNTHTPVHTQTHTSVFSKVLPLQN